MRSQLTYADRELIFRTFDRLKAESGADDHELLEGVSQWAKLLVPKFGFQLALTRDLTALSKYLTAHSTDEDIGGIARGALLYVLGSAHRQESLISELGLLGDALVCSYAVHEIQTRLDEPATYNPPRLTQDEQQRAEELFLKNMDNHGLDDDGLIERARLLARSLGNLSSCGLFQRLNKNIDFLICTLLDSGRSEEQRSYARAGLNYLACQKDEINDDLGLAGYLDDNFIAQLAVDLVEPNREPWLELLDEIVGVWPFLNGLVLDDGAGGRPISEYMMINSGLMCSELHDKLFPLSLFLIVPETGPTPFLLGFVSVLALIQQSERGDLKEQSFAAGQKVLVDNCSIAEFVGFRVIHGRKMFGLRQFYTDHGHRLEKTRYWPISFLSRLLPADSSRAIRGELNYDLGGSRIPLPALDWLLREGGMGQSVAVKQRVIVVMPTSTAHDIAKGLCVYGQLMKDVIPMGHLSLDGQVTPWSNRFGQVEPPLIFVSDIDVACGFVEDDPARTHLVIIEAKGGNTNRIASLRRLQHLRIPVLIISGESGADTLTGINEEESGVWEWTENDFSTVLWPATQSDEHGGQLATYERRLQWQSSFDPELRVISCPEAEQAFEAVRRLGHIAHRRGEERIADLDDSVTLAFGMMTRLLRAATPLTADTECARSIEGELHELNGNWQRSQYMSDEEQEAARTVEHSLRHLFAKLEDTNPKADAVHDMLATRPRLTLICPDKRLFPDLEQAYSHLRVRVMQHFCDSDIRCEGAIIPGWFRKNRMAELLIPPVTKPLHMVLYEIERQWYRAFLTAREKARSVRSAHSNRAKLFPRLRGWKRPKPEKILDMPKGVGDSSLQELEGVREHVRTAYRRRVLSGARSDGKEIEVTAYFVCFEGGLYGFFTQSYKANVVTHLIGAPIQTQDEKPGIGRQSVEDLRLGDALLFHLGSDSDVIRSAADKILSPGIRELSSLWRTSLLNYVDREEITSEELWQRLRKSGCPLKHHTIKTWLEYDNTIAPQAFERDVRIISELTKDDALNTRLEEVLSAISMVRSAHLSVSHELAQRVISSAVEALRGGAKHSALLEIEPNVVVARIIEIDQELTPVRVTLTNRLLQGEHWLE